MNKYSALVREATKDSKSFRALLLANSIPLLGVLFFQWSLFSVIFLYWLENVVVGIWNVIRMINAEGAVKSGNGEFKMNGKPYEPGMKTGLVIFFLFHYGMFTSVHGVFVLALFGPAIISSEIILFGLLPLFVSHYISYRTNFIGKGEYKNISAPELFIQPYSRIVVLHITIIFGGIMAKVLGAPIFALVLLVALKTFADSLAHLAEHSKFEQIAYDKMSHE